MNLEDGFPFFQVGKFDVDLTVKAACTHKCTVKNIGPVGGCEDDYPSVGCKTIHLGKELVQSVLTFIIGAGDGIPSTCPSDGIDLINKDDAGRFFLGLPEQVAHP